MCGPTPPPHPHTPTLSCWRPVAPPTHTSLPDQPPPPLPPLFATAPPPPSPLSVPPVSPVHVPSSKGHGPPPPTHTVQPPLALPCPPDMRMPCFEQSGASGSPSPCPVCGAPTRVSGSAWAWLPPCHPPWAQPPLTRPSRGPGHWWRVCAPPPVPSPHAPHPSLCCSRSSSPRSPPPPEPRAPLPLPLCPVLCPPPPNWWSPPFVVVVLLRLKL
jgi:hypothetical protein